MIPIARQSGCRSRARPKRRIAASLGLAGLLVAAAPPRCGPGSIRVTERPPDPALVDERGEADAEGFERLVAEAAQRRGLGFIRRPRLELLSEGDARLPALLRRDRDLEPCPRAGEAAPVEPAAGACFADLDFERVLCLAPPDLGGARRALARILDAQNYPRLADAAVRARGDAGVALRSLFAASADRPAAGPIPAAPDAEPFELLDLAAIDVEPSGGADDVCRALALAFLGAQRDPEAPFRAPPLSTKQLASPRAYRASERPHRLVGAAPEIEGCEIASDASVGVARLLVELSAEGGSIPGQALAGWAGDRGVLFDCADGRQPWLYVAELTDERFVAPFAQEGVRLLPGVFGGAAAVARLPRRVAAWHGVPASRARAFAASLESQERASLDGPD